MGDLTNSYIQDQAPNTGYIPEDKGILDYINPFSDIKPEDLSQKSSYVDPVSDALDRFADSPASGVAKSAPTFFDWDKNNTDRYTNSAYYKELGFDPGVDNETKYGERQTWGNTLGNAIGGGAGLAWQTFKSGWEGWGNMANALFSWDSAKLLGDIGKTAIGNPSGGTDLVKDWNDGTWGDKLLGSPQDLQAYNDENSRILNKYAIFSTPESDKSVFNKQFFGNMLQQGGFMLGTLAQAASEELLTEGLSSEATIAKLGTKAAKYMNKTIELGEAIKDMKNLGDIHRIPGIAENIWSGAKRLVPLSETADQLVTASKAGAGALQMATIGVGGVKRAMSEANMAFTFARMLAAGTYGDLNKKLTQEYIDRTGQTPVGDDFNKIQDVSQKAALGNFYIDSGLAGLTQRIQFDGMFSRFNTSRSIIKEVGEFGDDILSVTGKKVDGTIGTKVYDKGYFGAISNYSDIASTFGAGRAAWEVAKTASHGLMHWEIPSGIQMVLMDVSNNTMQDYYYDMYHGTKGYAGDKSISPDMNKSFNKAVGTEYNDGQGVKSFLMGALSGALLSPITFGIEKGVENYRIAKLDKIAVAEGKPTNALDKINTIKALNAYYDNPQIALKEQIASFKVGSVATQTMEEAVKNSDQYTWQNSKDTILANAVTAAKKTNMLPSLLDNIRGYADNIKSNQEFKDAFGIDPTQENITDTKQFINKIADRVEDFSRTYEHLKDKYGDLVMPQLYPAGSAAQYEAGVAKKALDNSLEVLATNKWKSERATVRAVDLLNEVGKNKNLGSSAASAFPILASEFELNKQTSTLTQEIADLEANPKKTPDINNQISNKKDQLDALSRWKEGWIFKGREDSDDTSPKRSRDVVDAEKSKDAYRDYINSKNSEEGIKTTINDDDVNDTFKSFQDYTNLNADHKEYIDAYNTLANPKSFIKYHDQSKSAIVETLEKLKQEHLEELGLNREDTLNSTTVTTPESELTEEEKANPDTNKTSGNITEGKEYITKPNPDNAWYVPEGKLDKDGKPVKRYNNDHIKILKIDKGATEADDRITVQVNNDKTYTVRPDQLAKKGKLYDLDSMSSAEKIYFKNRDQVIKLNVNKKYGKPHLNSGEHSDKDYSTKGIIVSGRLVLEKNEEGVNELKYKYKNPVTGKETTIDYNSKYFAKYGERGKNLRGLPSDIEGLETQREERARKNYSTQHDIFEKRLEEANDQLQQAQVNREENAQKFDELSKRLEDNKAELELTIDELSKFTIKPGRKSNIQKSLEKSRVPLENSIQETQDHIDRINSEKENLNNTIEALKQSKTFLEDAGIELMDTGAAFSRNGQPSLSSSEQEDYNNKDSNQITQRTSQDKVESLINDTQSEIDDITNKTSKLKGYISDIKNVLKNVLNIQGFLDFLNYSDPDNTDPRINTSTTSGIREYLRSKIADAPDEETKKSYQDLMDRVLRGGKDANNISFLINEFRDSVNKLADLNEQLKPLQEKQDRLYTALDQKQQLSSLQDRIDFLNKVQQTLTEGYQQAKESKEAEVQVTKPQPKPESQSDMTSDVIPDHTYVPGENKLPKFEETGFNKTNGRQFKSDDDKEPNTEHGEDRFFNFTAKQNVLGEGYQLEVHSEHHDPFGIRTPEYNPNDIKVVVVKNGKYIDQEGNELENPTKDNILYSSLTNFDNISVEYLRGNKEKGIRAKYSFDPNTTDEQIQQQIDAHKAYQEDLIKRSKEGKVYLDAISSSSGIQRVEYTHDGKIAQAEVEGRLVEDDPDWKDLRSANNPKVKIGLRIETAPSGGSTAPGIQPGRTIMQEYTVGPEGRKIWGDKVTRVFNRELTPEEKSKVTEALVRLVNLTDRSNSLLQSAKLSDKERNELNMLKEYISNVIPWSDIPDKRKRFFNLLNGLNRGEDKWPATEQSIRDNKDDILKDTYHHVNNKTLEKNESFTDIKQNIDGSFSQGKEWESYEQYLLDKRNDKEVPPPVYTSLPRIDSGIPHRSQSYINWSDPNTTPIEQIKVPERVVVVPSDNDYKVNPEVNTRLFGSKPVVQETPKPEVGADGFAKNDAKVINRLFGTKVPEETKPVEIPKIDEEPKSIKTWRELLDEAKSFDGNYISSKDGKLGIAGIVGAKSDVIDYIQDLLNKSIAANDRNKVLEQNTKETEKNSKPIPNIPNEEVMKPGGEIVHTDPEVAAMTAMPKDGKLSAEVYGFNINTGDVSINPTMKATVDVNGNLAQARYNLKKALMDQIQFDDEESPFRLPLPEFKEKEDFKKLGKFVEDNLPQFTINKMAELIHGKAWGTFKKSAIYIYENAGAGTGFHEAFHGVWDSYLSDKEQNDLLKEFQSRKGEFTNPYSHETKLYSEASMYDVTEMLADEFSKYVSDGLFPSTPQAKNFFQRVWEHIKNLLGLNKSNSDELNSHINKIFKGINSGEFRNAEDIREPTQEPRYKAVDGLSQAETAHAVEGLTYYMFSHLLGLKAEDGSYRNIDSILTNLNPEESRKLLNEIYDYAHDQVTANTQKTGVKRLEFIVNDKKKDLFEEVKRTLNKYGLDFEKEDNLTFNEENTTNALGIRDSISIDPNKMTGVNVKLLIGSLPDSKYIYKGGEYKIVPERNDLKQPKLVDFNKVQNILLNELSNIVPKYNPDGTRRGLIDTMFDQLDDKYRSKFGENLYRDGYLWIKNLKLRLKYMDTSETLRPIEALSDDDMKLRIAFEKSFNNARTAPQKTIVGEGGYIYNLNPVENVNTTRVRDEWANNLKSNLDRSGAGLITVNPEGTMILNRSSKEYNDFIAPSLQGSTFDFNKALNALNKLGITFSAGKRELNRYERTITGDAIQILDLIKKNEINTIPELYGNNIIGGRINNLLSIEAGFTGESNVLSYLNAEGESQYSVSLPSLLTHTMNSINTVGSLKELVTSLPWLGSVDETGKVALNGYQVNSELLKLGGPLFNRKGERNESKINHQILSGIGSDDYSGTSTGALKFPERIADKIHYLLNNTVYSIINSDKSTENGLNIPGNPLISFKDVKQVLLGNPEKVNEIYTRHLTDEMYSALYNKKYPSNIQYYKDQVKSLGHFKDILGPDLVKKFQDEVLAKESKYTGDNAHIDFLNNNKKQIDKAISNYLDKTIESESKFLKKNSIFEKQSNGMHTTDAIDNESLTKLLGIKDPQLVNLKYEGDEAIERHGYTEQDIKTLAGYLEFNEQVLNTEQHKLIYGHPGFYKDLAKRANGATSAKEMMIQDPDILKWQDIHEPRNDGKVRSSENEPTLKIRTFADLNVSSRFHKEIAEGMFEDMFQPGTDKTSVENKIGATFNEDGTLDKIQDSKKLLQNYLDLNEADALAYGMPDFVRDLLRTTNKYSREQQAQFAYEMAYEKVVLSKRDDSTNYSKEELHAAKNLLAEGDPGYIFQVLKTQYFGYAQDSEMMHPVFLKHAVQPRFFRHVEGTQFEKLYLAAKKEQTDLLTYESGEKVGNVENKGGGFTSIYNDKGVANIVQGQKGLEFPSEMSSQKLYSRFMGIQVETSAEAKSSVVRGTQITKIVLSNFFENGKPLSETIGDKVANYNNALVQLMQSGKERLLKKIGLVRTEDGSYETSDLKELVSTLRNEAIARELPDNMIEGIASILNENGSESLKYKFDTLTNKDKIDNILNSIVDSNVISEKMNGKSSIQIANSLYESKPRDFTYLKDGKYIQLSKGDITSLTEKEKKSIKMTSSDLKFYTKKDGKITKAEVYVTWPFKGTTPESFGLTLDKGIYRLSGNKNIDERLLNSIGFRIPTQGMNSIENMVIKGFTPIANGDMIVLPSEIVGKSGSDFDIDKLNHYLANHYIDTKTNSLKYIEWKGSQDKTRSFYSNLFDKGELLDEKQRAKLDNYIKDNQSLLDDTRENTLLKSFPALASMFDVDELSDENLTGEFTANLSKDNIIDNLVHKALQNHYMSTISDLLEEPSNYGQLVMPNSTDELKDLAKEINGYKYEAGTKDPEKDESSATYLRSFEGSVTTRQKYLTAKQMVGIAAVNITLHTLAQVSGLQVAKEFLIKNIYFLGAKDEKYRTITTKLDAHLPLETGERFIGHVNDVKGASISEGMSQKASGFVDGAKDPFVADLNISMNNAGTWFYMNHLGSTDQQIGYLYAQPILDKYFAQQATNDASFKEVNDNRLWGSDLFYNIVAPYYKESTGIDILKKLDEVKDSNKERQKVQAKFIQDITRISDGIPKFSSEDLIDNIKKGDKANPDFQIASLTHYLEMSAQALLLGNYNQAIGYDTKKTKTVQENMYQLSLWDKSKEQRFIANPDSVLDNTFLGEMKKQKEDIFNMFKNFFTTLSPNIRSVFQPLEDKLSSPRFKGSKDDKLALISRYNNFVLSYILHTTDISTGEHKEALNDIYSDLLQGKNSLAKQLLAYQKSSDESISNNLLIKELLPLINSDTTKTDNISLFRNKIDTFKNNNLIESLDNLKNYADSTANTKLSEFVDNLAKFSLIQSGLQPSRIDFRKVLSTQVYSDFVKKLLDTYGKQELNTDAVWKAFHQNNSSNKSVVPKAPSYTKIKGGVISVHENSNLAIHDFFTKTIRKEGLSKAAVDQLIRQKRGKEAFDTALFQRGMLTDKGYYIYERINKLGDGMRFTEIPTDPDAVSILSNNGNIKPGVPEDGGTPFRTIAETQAILDKRAAGISFSDDDKPVDVNPDPDAVYTGDQPVNIWAGSKENEVLSNMSNRPFSLDGKSYNSVEQYFQAKKADFTKIGTKDLFGKYPNESDNDSILDKINKSTNSYDIKKLGSQFKNLDTKNWDSKAGDVMKEGIKASFEQNPEALKALLATGDRPLTHLQDKGRWGKDFPKILMEVRDELKPQEKSPIDKLLDSNIITKTDC